MNLFKKKCKYHHYKAQYGSNAIQLDSMGYPLRLYNCKCENCGHWKSMWFGEPIEALKELDTGESFQFKWRTKDGR